MRYYLWELRPYFRQVSGQLVLGSIAGIIMNTAVVLPAILLAGRSTRLWPLNGVKWALALSVGRPWPSLAARCSRKFLASRSAGG